MAHSYKRDGWEQLLSVLNNHLYNQHTSVDEYRAGFNCLLDTPVKGMRLSGLGFLTQVGNAPATLLSAAALLMAVGTHITPDVLYAMYESIKDHHMYREEDYQCKFPNAVSSIGTGGKQLRTINVSTASAIVAASAGCPVVIYTWYVWYLRC